MTIVQIVCIGLLVTTALWVVYSYTREILHRRKKREIQVELPTGMDPNMAETIRQCFMTGKPVRGYYDEDGNYKTEVIETETK